MSARDPKDIPLIAPATTGSAAPTVIPPPADPLGPRRDPTIDRDPPPHQLDREVAEGDADLLDPDSPEYDHTLRRPD